MKTAIIIHAFSPSKNGFPIIGINSPEIRALTVGYIKNKTFIPGRLNFGLLRKKLTATAAQQSFAISEVTKILKKYSPNISTVTLLRETLACQLDYALGSVLKEEYYGDTYIGATHIKGHGEIKTAYTYENAEGLTPDGLWIIADSFCVGRNLLATMKSLLSQYHPKEIIFIGTLATRIAINNVGAFIAEHNIPTTFVVWSALFGLDEKTLYDMPWGHNDTEPIDARDQNVVVNMYGPKLCVGGDFGNNYYSPLLARELYEAQLKEHGITPKIPTVEEVMKIYKQEELYSE